MQRDDDEIVEASADEFPDLWERMPDGDSSWLSEVSLDGPAPWEIDHGDYTGQPHDPIFDDPKFDIDAEYDSFVEDQMLKALEALEAADEQDIVDILILESGSYIRGVSTSPKSATTSATTPPTPQPAKGASVAPSKSGLNGKNSPKAKAKKAAKQARRRRDYNAPGEYLSKACRFSDDPMLTDQLSVMHLIKEHLSGGPEGSIHSLWDRLREQTTVSNKMGRPRLEGDWPLIYAAGYVLDRNPEMVSFHDSQLNDPLWIEAGFDGRRPYSTMHDHFCELELFADAFESAADELVMLAKSKESRIGLEIYGDATNVHSRARLHHDCPDEAECKKKRKARKLLDPASPELVKDARKEEAKSEPLSDGDHPDAQRSSEPLPDDKYPHYVWVGDHRYGVLDPDVGVRAYTRKGNRVKKFWAGGLDAVLVDGFTGATLANIHAPASEQEFNLYEPLMGRAITALGGELPEVVALDRHYGIDRIYKWNTERGIASVIPFRKPGANFERHPLRCLDFDEHGVARCPHCGGSGEQIPGVTFTAAGNPRISFRCERPRTPECLRHEWSLDPAAYKHGWRALVPLSRMTPRYHACSQTSLHFEKNFRDRRKRYAVDGADETGKIKRFGLGAHRLRSAAARFLEWFRVCLRNGWLPGYKGQLNDGQVMIRNGGERLERVHLARRWQGLDLPYGKKAFALGLALDDKVLPFRETRRSKAKAKQKSKTKKTKLKT